MVARLAGRGAPAPTPDLRRSAPGPAGSRFGAAGPEDQSHAGRPWSAARRRGPARSIRGAARGPGRGWLPRAGFLRTRRRRRGPRPGRRLRAVPAPGRPGAQDPEDQRARGRLHRRPRPGRPVRALPGGDRRPRRRRCARHGRGRQLRRRRRHEPRRGVPPDAESRRDGQAHHQDLQHPGRLRRSAAQPGRIRTLGDLARRPGRGRRARTGRRSPDRQHRRLAPRSGVAALPAPGRQREALAQDRAELRRLQRTPAQLRLVRLLGCSARRLRRRRRARPAGGLGPRRRRRDQRGGGLAAVHEPRRHGQGHTQGQHALGRLHRAARIPRPVRDLGGDARRRERRRRHGPRRRRGEGRRRRQGERRGLRALHDLGRHGPLAPEDQRARGWLPLPPGRLGLARFLALRAGRPQPRRDPRLRDRGAQRRRRRSEPRIGVPHLPAGNARGPDGRPEPGPAPAVDRSQPDRHGPPARDARGPGPLRRARGFARTRGGRDPAG